MTLKISYDLQGGKLPSGSKLVENWDRTSRRVLPVPNKGGEAFLGWFTDGDVRVYNLSPSVVKDGMKLVAKFEKKEEPKKEEPKKPAPKPSVDTGDEDEKKGVVEDEKGKN